MQNYHYQIGAMGYIHPDMANNFTAVLQGKMTDGYARLSNFQAFASENNVINTLKLDIDEEGNLEGIHIYTNEELMYEHALKDCVEANLSETAEVTARDFGDEMVHDVTIAGNVITIDDEANDFANAVDSIGIEDDSQELS